MSPVITAHPTEVRRKTILQVMNEIAELLDDRSRLRHDPELDEIERRLSICILLLWQTALLRLSKLRVRDEINEAIRYYDASLFDVSRRSPTDFEDELDLGSPCRRVRVDANTHRHDGFVDRR